VVLSVGLNPPKDAQKFGRIFGIELNAQASARLIRSIRSRPAARAYSSAALQGPLDIPSRW